MNRTSLRRNLGVLAGVSLAMTLASSASAAPLSLSPVVMQFADGNDAGPQETDGGPGHEQSSVTYLEKDGKTYLGVRVDNFRNMTPAEAETAS